MQRRLASDLAYVLQGQVDEVDGLGEVVEGPGSVVPVVLVGTGSVVVELGTVVVVVFGGSVTTVGPFVALAGPLAKPVANSKPAANTALAGAKAARAAQRRRRLGSLMFGPTYSPGRQPKAAWWPITNDAPCRRPTQCGCHPQPKARACLTVGLARG